MDERRHVDVYRDASVSVGVIESVTYHGETSRAGCLVHANISPIAVIVPDAAGRYALDLEGRRVELDRLRRETKQQ